MNRNEKNGAVKRFRPQGEIGPGFAQVEATDSAVWIENDAQDYMRSMPSMVNGAIKDLVGEHMLVQSNLERISAFVIKGGEKEFALKDSTIRLSGYGASDFTSRGAGVLAWDKAKVLLENVDIETFGAGRPATIATEGATMRVYNSRLVTHGGQLPPGYVPVIGPGMMEPPFPLGLGGNCRTHLSMSGSETYFYNCQIHAGAWAALSTDSSGGYLYLEANDCDITVPGNGYVTYADNGCHVCLNRCTAQTGNMLAIQDGNSSLELNDVSASCGMLGFLVHGGMPRWEDTGIIEIKGGDIRSKDELFLCKSTNLDLYIKGARLESEKGVLLKTMLTDDEFYARNRTKGPDCYGIQVSIEDANLNGDVLHQDPERKLCLSLENSSLTGAVTGNVKLSLYGSSKLTATGDCEIELLSGDQASIDALPGVTIKAACSHLPAAAHTLPSGGSLVITKL